MTLELDLTPQAEAWLKAEAQENGLQPIDLIRRVIEERATLAVLHPVFKTPQERIAAMDALAASFRDRPHVTDAAFDRESIYEIISEWLTCLIPMSHGDALMKATHVMPSSGRPLTILLQKVSTSTLQHKIS